MKNIIELRRKNQRMRRDGRCREDYPQQQCTVPDIVCFSKRFKILSLRKGFQFVNFAKFAEGVVFGF